MEAITAGGSERQVLQLIRFLTQAGESPKLCVLRDTKWLTEEQAGCPVVFWNVRSLSTLSDLRKLAELKDWIRSGNFDAILTMFWEANLVGPILARWAGVPIVVGCRRNLNYWMSSRVAILQRVSNLFTTALLANCEAVKEVVTKMEHASPAKIKVLYNGIDTSRFRLNPEQRSIIRRALGIADHEVVVGNVSTLRPVKGLDLFVQAAARVAKQNSKCRFVLVGDGPEQPAIETAIRNHGLQGSFVLAGPQVDVVPFLNAFDIAVLSSYSEGFSNSILEYMAARLPCIATDVGGNAEALGDSGILVPPNDPAALAAAILRLADDSTQRSTLADVAFRRAEGTFALADAQCRFHEYLLSLHNVAH